MNNRPEKYRGRGSQSNPTNRFESFWTFPDESEDQSICPTQYYADKSKTVLTHNDSPDIFFDFSINPYRGCDHGCVYCYARPTHEYLGLSAGLDFESKIFIKENVAELLRRELSSKKWRPQVITLSGVTDPYQTVERRLKLTRKCLEVLWEFKNPVMIITKSALITRDIDLLREMAEYNTVSVAISITTLQRDLARCMEPRAPQPQLRLDTVKALRDHGISVGVLVAPIIPGLNDHEIPNILSAAATAGAQFSGHILLRMPYGIKDLFNSWVESNYPHAYDKIFNRIRSIRDGALNSTEFGERMAGVGPVADQIHQLFRLSCRRYGLSFERPKLSTDYFSRSPAQLRLL